MAEAPTLNDFFKKDKKKKIKGSNLNNAMNEKPAEEKKEAKKSKAEEDDGWHEEEVVQATMKVEVAGKLVREEEKEKEEETTAPAWGVIKNKEAASNARDDKKYPSLAKSVASSAINLEDKSGQVNISTSKNMFANLEDDDDDEGGPKRPKDIKPALVSKKKGEREKDAIQREVSKYKDPSKKDDKGTAEQENEDPEAEKEVSEVKPKKKDDKKASGEAKEEAKEQPTEMADLQIEPDRAAIKAKYIGRKKLPKKPLPPEELEEEKENKPQKPAGKKKKWAQIDEEEGEKKLEYAPF
mmetsp:Transcript_50757/g.94901  ORF Transcript_50757/g.94901 Transcript_50757/m.94901 type:complete len:297 (-) Transcript_50757:145-1035(-)